MAGNITEVLITEKGNSFTALLGLPPNQAVELLHEPELSQNQLILAMEINEDIQKRKLNQTQILLNEHQRFQSLPIDTDSNPDSPPIFSDSNEIKKRSSTKRKEREKIKVKVCGGKSKDNEISEKEAVCKKLPYVHCSRRGQATDSHSLAERARREKINARMKLLQKLVPGCAKIKGIALVLDEIINHVQSLQRQVEFLSMKLATVNPRIDFSLLSSTTTGTRGGGTEHQFQYDQQLQNHLLQQPHLWHPDMLQQQPLAWERDGNQSFAASSCNPTYSGTYVGSATIKY
ncbi:hypothetical protein MKX01_037795 [Papaver californicum]|nr:hypothetical protein MKX01_037795 [Papaver californicum]